MVWCLHRPCQAVANSESQGPCHVIVAYYHLNCTNCHISGLNPPFWDTPTCPESIFSCIPCRFSTIWFLCGFVARSGCIKLLIFPGQDVLQPWKPQQTSHGKKCPGRPRCPHRTEHPFVETHSTVSNFVTLEHCDRVPQCLCFASTSKHLDIFPVCSMFPSIIRKIVWSSLQWCEFGIV